MPTTSDVHNWVREQASLCQPDAIHWCDGTPAEYQHLSDLMVRSGTLTRLNQELRPNCYLARSDPSDVARVEERTFICCEREQDAGPTNNWRDPNAMRAELLPLFAGCMRGRTMYVIPFLLGPQGAHLARYGVQLTDSPYVAASMHLMTRIQPVGQTLLSAANDNFIDSTGRLPAVSPPCEGGDKGVVRPYAIDQTILPENPSFVRCLHSVGAPLSIANRHSSIVNCSWPCNDTKYIAHFPESREIWSFGSGYGGNALLSKKCFALRIASKMACDEGWLAEHMLIMGITSPEGVKKYFAAAFPSQCGKTNLSMLTPTLPGWKVECVGDDIAWMHFGDDGQLYAINPEAGFFGVAPGTSRKSNPHAMETVSHDTIFTNVAQTPEGDVWWEGMTPEPPPHLIDWRGQPWTPQSGARAAHPNSRFTARVAQCPVVDPHWDDPRGVPISAILFGGRRPDTVPLVYEAFDWNHGVFLGSIVSSATTAAADGATGRIRHDPFAMTPFCGYHMADYFAHWLSLGEDSEKKLPKFYAVNWFRTNEKGEWLWPGFGENIRVLKWVFERTEGTADAIETPIGKVPTAEQLSIGGNLIELLSVEQALAVHQAEWLREVGNIRKYYGKFAERLPNGLWTELQRLESLLESGN